MLLSLLFSVTPLATPIAGPPEVTLTNGVIKVRVVLPDEKVGYYRGQRFDWSGLIAQVEYKGNTYVEEWQSPHDPYVHDHAIGTAEEFGIEDPVGFEEAKPGESFLKIGVGVLRRPDDKPYSFVRKYETIAGGKWTTSSNASSVTFKHEIGGVDGYGYVYTKVISLVPNKPELKISRTLVNTGKRAIAVHHYGHHFVQFNKKTVGPDYTVAFPFAPRVIAEPKLHGPTDVKDKQIVVTGSLATDYAFAAYEGFGTSLSDHSLRIEERTTGAFMQIKGDRPLAKLRFFAVGSAFCPENFVLIQAGPGQRTSWANSYTFGAR